MPNMIPASAMVQYSYNMKCIYLVCTCNCYLYLLVWMFLSRTRQIIQYRAIATRRWNPTFRFTTKIQNKPYPKLLHYRNVQFWRLECRIIIVMNLSNIRLFFWWPYCVDNSPESYSTCIPGNFMYSIHTIKANYFMDGHTDGRNHSNVTTSISTPQRVGQG